KEADRMEEHQERLRSGQFQAVRIDYKRRNGESAPMLINPGMVQGADGKTYYFAIVKDLTEIEKAEDELRESEAKFRRIAETSADAIYLIDLEGTVTYISPAVESILGFTPEEFAGSNFAAHFTGDDLVRAQEAFAANIRGEEVRNLELRVLDKNKKPVYIEVNGTPVRKGDRIIGIQGMGRDISKRKSAEQALRESKIKFEAEYMGMPIPVYTWQKQGDDFVLIDFNRAAERITEDKIGELRGVTARKLYANLPDIIEDLRVAYDEKRFLQRDMLYRFKSTGSARYLRVAPPDLVLVHTEDVTAHAEAEERLRESEAMFRTAVENIPFDFFVIGEDGRYTMQNSVCKERWGDVTGMRPEDVAFDEDLRSLWLANNARAWAGEVVEGDVTFKIGGEERCFHNIIAPVYDSGRVRGVLGVNIDITNRIKAEEALRESEERLSGVISSTPDVGIEGYDAKGRVLFWNTAAEKIFGWPSREAVGKTLDRLILDGAAARRFAEALENIAATGRPSEPEEWNITTKSGEERTVYSTIFAIPGSAGKNEYVRMDIDITARKLTEKALRESEEKYRFLIENVGTSVTFWDPNGKLLLINKAGARNLGSTPEALVGRSLSSFVDDEYAQKLRARHKRVMELNSGAQFEDPIELKRGKRWYRSIIQPVNHPDGEPIGVQVVSHDITELVEAERELKDRTERLRLMVQQIPAILWTTDTGLRFTSSTGAGLEALGLEQDEVAGRTLYEFFGTDDKEFLPISMHLKTLSGEPTTFEIEWGNSVWETHTEPLRDDTNEIIGCLAIALDVTERKRADEEIKRSRTQRRRLAKRLHEVREEESAAISREIHDELGQVLTGFKMDLAWIRRRCAQSCTSPESPTVTARIQDMFKEIDSTFETVRKLSTRLHPRILDDMGLLGAIEWSLQSFEDRTGIKCVIKEMDFGEAGKALDSARSTAIFRIFQEVITNIGRHAGASRVDVELWKSGDLVILEVRDNGRGIPAEELKHPRGIGLLGMSERAQAFGGNVTLDSKPGKGARVRVSIPISELREG
ncbi:MAG: PAS domain S-box protein, partial [bacterium]